MNITKPSGGEGPSVILSLPALRLQTKRDRSLRAVERLWAVEDAAAKAIINLDSATLIVSAAHLARTKTLQLMDLMGGRAYGYQPCGADAATLARGRDIFGSDHPGAEQQIARLAALQCRPYADEIAYGLVNVVNWISHNPKQCNDFGEHLAVGRAR